MRVGGIHACALPSATIYMCAYTGYAEDIHSNMHAYVRSRHSCTYTLTYTLTSKLNPVRIISLLDSYVAKLIAEYGNR